MKLENFIKCVDGLWRPLWTKSLSDHEFKKLEKILVHYRLIDMLPKGPGNPKNNPVVQEPAMRRLRDYNINLRIYEICSATMVDD